MIQEISEKEGCIYYYLIYKRAPVSTTEALSKLYLTLDERNDNLASREIIEVKRCYDLTFIELQTGPL